MGAVKPTNGRPVGREAWGGVAFFVLLGALVLLLDRTAIVGWVSLATGALSALALWAVRRGWRPTVPARARRGAPRSDPGRAHPGDVVPLPRHDPRRPVPTLSPEGRRRVDEVVAALDRAGVWAPSTPDPALLYPPVADLGEPVTVEGVLDSLGEVAYYSPRIEPTTFTERLAYHHNQVEQWADDLREQVADLARLAGGTVEVEVRDVHQEIVDTQPPCVRTKLDLRVAGEPLVLDYLGVGKYVSTVLHVHLARALRRAGAPFRIAWLQRDHLLLAGLPDVDLDLDRFNADLGLPPADPQGWGGWTWVDECEPVALGDDDGRRTADPS